MPDFEDQLSKYRGWFYAAAIYNAVWGTWTVLFPNAYFDLIGMDRPVPAALWQVVGMCIAVYAPAYWWMGRHPGRFRNFIIVALLGKTLGPLGFVFSFLSGQLPLAFAWTLLTNDLLWWPAFWLYLRDVARLYGGIKALILGE
jgi:hypothetical protein